MAGRARSPTGARSPKSIAPEFITELKPLPTLRGIAALEAQLVDVGWVRKPTQQPESREIVPSVPIPNFGKVRRMAKQAYGEEAMAIFVMPRKTYGSYHDFWRLAKLSGFELLFQDEIDLRDPRQTYIFAAPERIPDCTGARARTIFWSMEYAGDYTAVENAATVSEVWSSDPAHARRTGAKYVLLGSHQGLNPDLRPADEPQFDLTMLAYMVERRLAVKDRLDRYSWTPDYPGHSGVERHNILRHTRLMLHVHQHDAPVLAPLRLALAAAYQMPVISEVVEDEGPYRRAVIWSQYGDLASRVKLYLDGKIDDDIHYEDALYRLLCVDQPFGKCVTEALESTSVSAVHGIAA